MRQSADKIICGVKISRPPVRSALARRRAVFARARLKMLARRRFRNKFGNQALQPMEGYDPELLYVECGRCGAPVLWEEGRATALLRNAGIDPMELDSSCLMITDGCPACGSRDEYSVRIYRISPAGISTLPPAAGHA